MGGKANAVVSGHRCLGRGTVDNIGGCHCCCSNHEVSPCIMLRGSALLSAAAVHSRASSSLSVTGMPAGPFEVGVTTMQFEDTSRTDPTSGSFRRLQTEIWYPAAAEAASLPRNVYSEYLGRGVIPGSIAAAETDDAIGGYRDGLTIEELDRTWPNQAVRDARPCDTSKRQWPLVIFSHGSGAFRASYLYWTEFLASHGFCVMACDHVGSARYTQIQGEVVKPGGARSERAQMEADRPADLLFLIDCMASLAAGADSRFAARVDTDRVALTGMSFGGFSTAAAMEACDPRVKAAIMKCPSIATSAGGTLDRSRKDMSTPVMVMLGKEDTVIGESGNAAGREYVRTHRGPAHLVEIVRGGHVSFTSCELYNEAYGNGIGESVSLTSPGSTYTPLDIAEQHAIVNSYGLAFLNTHLRADYEGQAGTSASASTYNADYLAANRFGDDEV